MENEGAHARAMVHLEANLTKQFEGERFLAASAILLLWPGG